MGERWRWAAVRGGLVQVCRGSARVGCEVRSRMLMGAACCAVYRALRLCFGALGEAGCITARLCCKVGFAPGEMVSACGVGLR